MEESILITIKKLLGLPSEDTSFDLDIITHINSTFNILYQLGVGSPGFLVTDNSATWADYLEDDVDLLSLVRSYVYMMVRKMFDPPQNSTAMEALNSNINELTWRINISVDPRSAD